MKNPELYSVNFFRELKKRMDNSSILITYNSSPIIRAGLIEAGFKLQKYRISKYEEGTIANFNEENLTESDKKLIRAFSLSIQDTSKEVNLV